jgi:hypothetical protein
MYRVHICVCDFSDRNAFDLIKEYLVLKKNDSHKIKIIVFLEENSDSAGSAIEIENELKYFINSYNLDPELSNHITILNLQ